MTQTNDDPWEIPEFLRLTLEQRRAAWASYQPKNVAQTQETRDMYKPKGMLDDEWEATKASFDRVDAPKEAIVIATKKKVGRSNIPDKAKIRVLLDKNPHEKGSKRYERFAKFRNGMTVAQAIEKGVTKAELRWSVVTGLIAIE
jgi:hypothetical protein